jgi:hypothetical protein
MTTTITNIEEGERRKVAGMELAAARKGDLIHRAQKMMVEAAFTRPGLDFTSDDISDDLGREYSDGGAWVGAAVRGLALAGISIRAGQRKSQRPSRHANEVKVWKIRDVEAARAFCMPIPSRPQTPSPEIGGLFGGQGITDPRRFNR